MWPVTAQTERNAGIHPLWTELWKHYPSAITVVGGTYYCYVTITMDAKYEQQNSVTPNGHHAFRSPLAMLQIQEIYVRSITFEQ